MDVNEGNDCADDEQHNHKDHDGDDDELHRLSKSSCLVRKDGIQISL